MIEVHRLRLIPEFSPQVTEEQVRESLRHKIEIVVTRVQSPSRLGFERGQSWPLFFMNADFAEIPMSPESEEMATSRTGRIDRQQGQEILLEVMRSYGFDESKSSGHKTRDQNGLRVESLSFPSQTIPGLEFQRTVGLSITTGDPVYVEWCVVDKGPRFLFKRQQVIRGSHRPAHWPRVAKF